MVLMSLDDTPQELPIQLQYSVLICLFLPLHICFPYFIRTIILSTRLNRTLVDPEDKTFVIIKLANWGWSNINNKFLPSFIANTALWGNHMAHDWGDWEERVEYYHYLVHDTAGHVIKSVTWYPHVQRVPMGPTHWLWDTESKVIGVWRHMVTSPRLASSGWNYIHYSYNSNTERFIDQRWGIHPFRVLRHFSPGLKFYITTGNWEELESDSRVLTFGSRFHRHLSTRQ